MPRKAASKSVNHLRAWREYRQMTQDELAEKIGTAGNVISLLESGGRRLSDKWLYKLAPALRTRPGFLLEFDPYSADLTVLETITDIPKNRQAEALRLLQVFKTGTND
jgi:transcriptional regulator with XRE-family HTH domain